MERDEWLEPIRKENYLVSATLIVNGSDRQTQHRAGLFYNMNIFALFSTGKVT
ncbi:hypothetical protein AOG1_23910 [Geobacter sp. AOG1]|nr:hypothetical protein AOG1_23910 [Geobacter sp. AOG1]